MSAFLEPRPDAVVKVLKIVADLTRTQRRTVANLDALAQWTTGLQHRFAPRTPQQLRCVRCRNQNALEREPNARSVAWLNRRVDLLRASDDKFALSAQFCLKNLKQKPFRRSGLFDLSF